MILKICKKIAVAVSLAVVVLIAAMQTGCGVYRFKDVSIPDSVKIVRVNIIENKAPYVNPVLAPKLTEALKRKISGSTRLGQTNGDNADWDITCVIKGYSFSTAGISNQTVNTSRLAVNVAISVVDKKTGKPSKYDVSRNFDFNASLSVQQAEQNLEVQMLRDLSDDIFNRIFSNW